MPLFKNLNFEGIINLISLLEIRIYLPDEFILYENQASEEMYFIQSGMLEVFDTRRSLKIRLFEGDFFGEQVIFIRIKKMRFMVICIIKKAIINRNSKRKASIKSTVYSELLILSRKGLETIVLENEAFARRLFGYLKKKILNNFHNSPRKTSKWFFLNILKKFYFP